MSSSTPLFQSELRKRAAHLKCLKKNWDGYQGDPPDHETLDKAVALALVIAPFFPEYEPALVPTGDGSIQVEWHDEGYDIEMLVQRV